MVKLKPHEVDFVAGGETRLTCTAEASPPARIRWRRRGREIRATDRIGSNKKTFSEIYLKFAFFCLSLQT